MDYSKVDSALASALGDARSGVDADLRVSVRTATLLNVAQIVELQRLGVHGAAPGRTIFSATVSARTIEQLAAKPWVQRLSLAQTMNPLGY